MVLYVSLPCSSYREWNRRSCYSLQLPFVAQARQHSCFNLTTVDEVIIKETIGYGILGDSFYPEYSMAMVEYVRLKPVNVEVLIVTWRRVEISSF